MSEILEVGNKAPDFAVTNQDGKSVNLNDLSGKWAVIYFYPRDDTPGCTIEANEFTELYSKFQDNNAIVIGVSPDNEAKHCKFIDKYELNNFIYIDLLC